MSGIGSGIGRWLSRWGSRSIGVTAAVAALLAGSLGAGGATAAPLPESYSFLTGIEAELSNPEGSLPGTNDFDCRPSAEHPRPVVLVHGTGGSQQTNWAALAPVLVNQGYCVFAPTYGALPGSPWPINRIGGMGSIPVSAGELDTFVDRVRAATGAETVDIVGHSQGTYMPLYYLKHRGGAEKVTNYVAIAPLYRGTMNSDLLPLPPVVASLAGGLRLPICEACTEMLEYSPVNRAIWRGGSPYVPGVAFTNIVTRYDELVLPHTSGLVPGRVGEDVTNIVVQDGCEADLSEHAAVAASRRTAVLTLNALDPANPAPVPCLPVAPIVG